MGRFIQVLIAVLLLNVLCSSLELGPNHSKKQRIKSMSILNFNTKISY